MGRFPQCLAFVLRPDIEGGYVNDLNDRGGATNHGITQRVYDDERMMQGLPLKDVRDITPAEVAGIYRADYWEPVHGDRLDAPLDLVMFDAAVQHGVKRAVKMLQRCVGAAEDGVFGPATLAAAGQVLSGGLSLSVIRERRRFYARIIENDRLQIRFAQGWENRLVALKREAGLPD